MSKILLHTVIAGIIAGLLYIVCFVIQIVPSFENAQFFSIVLFSTTVMLLFSVIQYFGTGKYIGVLLLVCIFYPILFPFSLAYLKKFLYYAVYFSLASITLYLWKRRIKTSIFVRYMGMATDIVIIGLLISLCMYLLMGYSIALSLYIVDTIIRFTCIGIALATTDSLSKR